MEPIFEHYFVGALAEDAYTQEVSRKNAVFIAFNNNTIVFFVKRQSACPRDFPQNIHTFVGYDDAIGEYGFEDDANTSDDERIAAVKDFFDDKLMLFKPYRSGDGRYSIDKYSVQMIVKPTGYSADTYYLALPQFNSSKTMGTLADFQAKLAQGKYVGTIEGLSHGSGDTPEFVVWYDEATQTRQVLGPMTGHQYTYGGYQFDYEQLQIVDFCDEWIDSCIWYKDIILIPMAIVEKIQQEIFGKTALAVPARRLPATGSPTEGDFIDGFIATTHKRGYLYSEADLVNFHTAMKTSKLVLLSGMSGTGKSKLVSLYAEALGLGRDQYAMIPVRPSWSDDADLLGYADVVHNVYQPGDSGLIDILLQAQQHPEQLYLICFDEMNLARVEHYFSQLLSVLEMDVSERVLHLYNGQLATRLYNRNDYPPTIGLGDNILFAGTVNIDESTYHFSDKVLDRANVMQLEVLPFSRLKTLIHDHRTASATPGVGQMTFAQYDAYRVKDEAITLTNREIAFLEDLYDLLVKAKGSGFGYRIVRQVNGYLSALADTAYLTRGEAFDLQVVQRVFTKLRGSEDQLIELIGRYNSAEKEPEQSHLLTLFNTYDDVSAFTKSKTVLNFKAKELKLSGYTI